MRASERRPGYELYVVSVRTPPGVSRKRMQAFIKEAISTWGGQLPPRDGIPGEVEGDPLGPPCALNRRGAVLVEPVSNGAERRVKHALLLTNDATRRKEST